jgi:hypothetical protein
MFSPKASFFAVRQTQMILLRSDSWRIGLAFDS